MKGTREVIDVLNQALVGELVAIQQYFMHARIFSNRGYDVLADRIQKQAMEEMTHAETLTDRILFLEGVPEPRLQETPRIGRSVREQLQNDLALEQHATKMLNDGIAVTRAKGDNGSADILTKILADEEEHMSWLETQLALIEKLGQSTYLLGQLRA